MTAHKVIELQNKNHYVDIMVSDDERYCHIVETEKKALYYQVVHSSGSMIGLYGNEFEIINSSLEDVGHIFVIYRFNENIDTIKVTFEDGETRVLDDWTENISYFILENPENTRWPIGTFQAFDKAGNFIEEKLY